MVFKKLLNAKSLIYNELLEITAAFIRIFLAGASDDVAVFSLHLPGVSSILRTVNLSAIPELILFNEFCKATIYTRVMEIIF